MILNGSSESKKNEVSQLSNVFNGEKELSTLFDLN